jgi:Protein of unknown function (DUF3184).
MRRPHRSTLSRVKLLLASLGRTLPPPARRVFRSLISKSAEAGLRRVPAQTVTSYDAWRSQDELARTVVDVVRADGIDAVRLSRSGKEWLAIDARQRRAAIHALQGSVAADWIVRERGRRPVRLGSLDAGSVGKEFQLFQHLRTGSGQFVAGPEVSVNVGFWRAVRADTVRPDGGFFDPGTRLPPSRNQVAPYLAPAQWDAARTHPQGRPPAQRLANLLEFDGPIDAVYTWVDGSDPQWQAERAAHWPSPDGLAADALDPARTRDREELRYSLRSLSMYANWIRKVWIVTSGQVPEWLALDNPRLQVVSQAEIFTDPGALPVFNSHAIESQLHHIPGLAEHFLYLNDDFFFGRPVRPELFFHGNGLPKLMTSPIAIDLDLDTDARNGATLAARTGRKWLEDTFDRTVTNRMRHVPHAHRRSVLADLEALIPDDVDRVAHSKFRHRDDLSIPSELGHYYGYATGRAVTGRLEFEYIDLDSPLAAERLAALLATRASDCFCVNDVGGAFSLADSGRLSRFFEDYFPLPGEFERGQR